MGQFGVFSGLLMFLCLHVVSVQGYNDDGNVLRELGHIDKLSENASNQDEASDENENADNENEDENEEDRDSENEGSDEDTEQGFPEEEDIDDESREEDGDEEDAKAKMSFGSVKIKKVTIPSYSESCYESMCQMKITPIGCYHDSQTKRPLPLLLDSHRDVTSHAYHGQVFDWRNAEKSIRKLACDCVKKARKHGYTHIGLQFYGECWSSKTAAKDFSKDGRANSCVNGKYTACKRGEFCVGQSLTNYVYRVDSLVKPGLTCTTKYEKVGCFHDPVTTKHRPLPELLDSHRDITSHVHDGHIIDWNNYKASLEKLVCHCAVKAKKRGHTHFGIEYYGECWSGKHSGKTYNKYGPSKNCVSHSFTPCDPKSDCLCSGKGFSLFVYKV